LDTKDVILVAFKVRKSLNTITKNETAMWTMTKKQKKKQKSINSLIQNHLFLPCFGQWVDQWNGQRSKSTALHHPESCVQSHSSKAASSPHALTISSHWPRISDQFMGHWPGRTQAMLRTNVVWGG